MHGETVKFKSQYTVTYYLLTLTFGLHLLLVDCFIYLIKKLMPH